MNASAPAPAPQPLGPIDPNRRYPVEDALKLLGYSRFTLYLDIKEGRIQTIKDRRRRFVPGSEIIRRSSLPPQTAA